MGITFLSHSPSSVFTAKEYFPCCQQTSAQPVCLPLYQFYSSKYYAFCYNVYYLQCLTLENNIQTFTVINSVQRKTLFTHFS